MNEGLPSISMSRDARYVTQSSIYTTQATGKLTNRRIREWQALGYYDSGLKLPPVQKRSRTANSSGRRARLLAALEQYE